MGALLIFGLPKSKHREQPPVEIPSGGSEKIPPPFDLAAADAAIDGVRAVSSGIEAQTISDARAFLDTVLWIQDLDRVASAPNRIENEAADATEGHGSRGAHGRASPPSVMSGFNWTPPFASDEVWTDVEGRLAAFEAALAASVGRVEAQRDGLAAFADAAERMAAAVRKKIQCAADVMKGSETCQALAQSRPYDEGLGRAINLLYREVGRGGAVWPDAETLDDLERSAKDVNDRECIEFAAGLRRKLEAVRQVCSEGLEAVRKARLSAPPSIPGQEGPRAREEWESEVQIMEEVFFIRPEWTDDDLRQSNSQWETLYSSAAAASRDMIRELTKALGRLPAVKAEYSCLKAGADKRKAAWQKGAQAWQVIWEKVKGFEAVANPEAYNRAFPVPDEEELEEPRPSSGSTMFGGITYRIDGNDYYCQDEGRSWVLKIPQRLKPVFIQGVIPEAPNVVQIRGSFTFRGNTEGTNAFGAKINVEVWEADAAWAEAVNAHEEALARRDQKRQQIERARGEFEEQKERASREWKDRNHEILALCERIRPPADLASLQGILDAVEDFKKQAGGTDRPGAGKSAPSGTEVEEPSAAENEARARQALASAKAHAERSEWAAAMEALDRAESSFPQTEAAREAPALRDAWRACQKEAAAEAEAVRRAKIEQEREAAYRQCLAEAEACRAGAERSDLPADWSAVREAAERAKANSDTEEVRNLIALATGRRDLSTAREAEKNGDFEQALALARRAQQCGIEIPGLAGYLKSVEAKKAESEKRQDRRKRFEALAAIAEEEEAKGPSTNLAVAVALWKKALEFADDDAQNHRAKARIHALSLEQQNKEADRAYTEAMSAAANALASGNLDAAEEAFRDALRVKNEDGAAIDGLKRVETARTESRYRAAMDDARTAEQSEDWDAAAKAYERALGEKPGDPEAQAGASSVKARSKNTPPDFAPSASQGGFVDRPAEDEPGRCLRRGLLGVRGGLASFLGDSTALDANLWYPAGQLEYKHLWEPAAAGLSLEAGLAVMPAASLMLQASWAAFKDKSVAGFYLANPSLPSEHPVIENVDDLRIFQTIVATRISLPLQQLVSHPGNLTRIGKAADAEGFVPYFYAGAGFTFLDRVEVNVRQSSGGPVSFYSRDLFDRTLNLSFAGGLGLEYRVWFFSCDVRAEASWNGTPKTGWKPYTDAAEDLVTFQFQFGVRVSF